MLHTPDKHFVTNVNYDMVKEFFFYMLLQRARELISCTNVSATLYAEDTTIESQIKVQITNFF